MMQSVRWKYTYQTYRKCHSKSFLPWTEWNWSGWNGNETQRKTEPQECKRWPTKGGGQELRRGVEKTQKHVLTCWNDFVSKLAWYQRPPPTSPTHTFFLHFSWMWPIIIQIQIYHTTEQFLCHWHLNLSHQTFNFLFYFYLSMHLNMCFCILLPSFNWSTLLNFPRIEVGLDCIKLIWVQRMQQHLNLIYK